jgi:NADH-quinone oxidoreductase subunit A
MTELVLFILIFVGVGIAFLLVNLLIGRLLRPHRPEPEKLEIYECGEPTVGSAWIQFDLRFYVVALLFVIFGVEVAFFFPWAVVFGKLNRIADPTRPGTVWLEESYTLTPPANPKEAAAREQKLKEEQQLSSLVNFNNDPEATTSSSFAYRYAASNFAWLILLELLIFFGVLLVGFAYLWKRGDLEWVRSLTPDSLASPTQPPDSLALVQPPAPVQPTDPVPPTDPEPPTDPVVTDAPAVSEPTLSRP